MVFNSLEFAAFFAVFFLLYWFPFRRSVKAQNLLVLAGSYAFYAWWDWRFLPLLAGTTALYYVLGLLLGRDYGGRTKGWLLSIGIAAGIGGLFFFKYADFFAASLVDSLAQLGIRAEIRSLNLILPLGISFYTFRTLGYLIDVYLGKAEPARDPVAFAAYVAFFPSLISGPIDKAKTLLPQFAAARAFDGAQAADGLRQILWGLFKKAVIADNCADVTDQVFAGYAGMPASSLLAGAFFYTLQIYADFSGYSDMALGFARLIGFRITRNFDFPFFSQNIAEFWRKWHISLTAWLTEYVFTPLTIMFRDHGNAGLILAILVNFTLIGIWHGANWTFVLFGFLHGLYYIPLVLRGTVNKKRKIAKGGLLPSFREALNVALTFTVVMLTFVVFRSDTVSQALDYLGRLFSPSLFEPPVFERKKQAAVTLLFAFLMLAVEWVQRERSHGLDLEPVRRPAFRFAAYYALAAAVLVFGAFGAGEFIYFKF